MCGIIAYIGPRPAKEILLQGLFRLEYRGYDSAGIAICDRQKIMPAKSVGTVSELKKLVKDLELTGTIGIGHTRWATHGAPTSINAHPHHGPKKRIWLVHNGIIENFREIKQLLEEQHGYSFYSETDTEVLACLIEHIMTSDTGLSLNEAVREALEQVHGAYAIVVMDEEYPDKIVAAKRGSPLIIGYGEGEMYIASDAAAFAQQHDGETPMQMTILDDNQIATVERKGVTIHSDSGSKINPKITPLLLRLEEIELGDYEHFMQKEINSQPASIKTSLSGRIFPSHTHLNGVYQNIDRFRKTKRIVIIACGTSWNAGLVAKYWFETLAGIPTTVEYASEYSGHELLNLDDIVIAISQSGETADTVSALKRIRSKNIFCYGIVNAVGSSIARLTQSGSYIHVGPEISVASTKAFTGQLAVLATMAIQVGMEREYKPSYWYQPIIDSLVTLPDKVAETLTLVDRKTAFFAKTFSNSEQILLIGRGVNLAVAYEGALKLKELAYIPCDAQPSGELKHGHIALIDQGTPVVVIATNGETFQKVMSNAQEVHARGGRIIGIHNESATDMEELSTFSIIVPETHPLLAPILNVIPLQLCAYYMAIARGKNVDKPRNLAKSVTVE